jgi:two-component system chemotaxis sensor kinase CheA
MHPQLNHRRGRGGVASNPVAPRGRTESHVSRRRSDPGVLLESSENLNQLDRDFVALEKNPDDRACLGAIFRCVHTIKGTSGFLRFAKLEALTHAGESLLSRLRDGSMRLDAASTTLLLSMVDAVRRILSTIEASGAEGDADDAALVGALTRAAQGGAAPAPAAAPAAPAPAVAPADAPAPAAALAAPAPDVDSALARGPAVSDTTIRVDVGLLDRV